jgi:hypothetical protein
MDAIREKSIGLDGGVSPERRAVGRRRVLKGARLTFNKGYGALECVVRNESQTGALLVFGETAAVPSSFELEINGSGQARVARVRWRTPTLVGVEYAPA